MTIYMCSSQVSGQDIQFKEQVDLLRFVQGTMGQSKSSADMNGDGVDDFTRVAVDGIHIDFQKTDGSYTYRHFKMKIDILPVYSICAGDINNDGYNDLVFGGSNNVSFVMYDPTQDRYVEQVMPQMITAQRSTLFDIDNDGDLDAFVCNDVGKSLAYKNDGKGSMLLDQTLINTSPLAGNYSAIWVDYNKDGNTDLYVSKCLAETLPGDPRRTNLMYKNNGDGTFNEVGSLAGINDNAQSWTTAFEDFDHDGDFDAFVVNHDQENRLFRNNGNGTFTDVILQSGIDSKDLGASECVAGDFNNDGNMDILSGLKNQLYLGNGDLTFVGQKLPFSPYNIGDYNDDGHLDCSIRNQIYLNNGNQNHWLKLRLIGVESNRNGIGSRIELKTKLQSQMIELRAGQSYSPMQSLNAHFGLDTCTIVDEIVVYWPSGTITRLHQLKADSMYSILETMCLSQTEKIGSSKELFLCPGEELQLSLPDRYQKYKWNTGDTINTIVANWSGIFSVIYEDSLQCRGFSNILIQAKDSNFPKMITDENNFIECKGETLELNINSDSKVMWSNGEISDHIKITESGIYYFMQDSICNDGIYQSDRVTVDFLEVSPPNVTSISYLNDSVKIEVSGLNCVWFMTDTINIPFSKGCILQYKNPSQETVVYVQDEVERLYNSFVCGKRNLDGFTSLSNIPRRMYFTVNEDFVLENIDIYSKTETKDSSSIYVVNLSGDTICVQLFTTVLGLNTLHLSCSISQGSYYLSTDAKNLLMNIGPLDYPYPIGKVGTIDSASISLNFYPFFYNWKLRKATKLCVSTRQPILLKPSSVHDLSSSIVVYPNPALNEIVVENTFAQKWSAQIMNANGKLFFLKDDIGSVRETFDVMDFPQGLYLIKIISDEIVFVRKFLVLK